VFDEAPGGMMVDDPAVTNEPTGGFLLPSASVLTTPTAIIGTVNDPVSTVGLTY
jgi:hypothetical protein